MNCRGRGGVGRAKAGAVLAAAILLSARSRCHVEARSWWSLEISAFEGMRDADPMYGAGGPALLMEDTSFMYGLGNNDGGGGGGPMDFESLLDYGDGDEVKSVPTAEISDIIDDAGATPSMSTIEQVTPYPPAASLTDAPTTSSPTPSPSGLHEAYNGRCPEGHALHRLWMYDSAGDGWGPARLVVRAAAGSGNGGGGGGGGGGRVVFAGGLDGENGVVEYEAVSMNAAGKHVKGSKRRNHATGNRRLIRGLQTDNGEEGERHDHASSEELVLLSAAGSFAGVKTAGTAGGGTSSSMASGFAKSPPAPDSAFEKAPPAPYADEDNDSREWTYLCLKRDTCYSARLSGGTSLGEASWEITEVELGTGENVGLVARGVGGGTGACEFSLEDGDGNAGCDNTCDGTVQIAEPTSSPIDPVPSQGPTDAPVVAPTEAPTAYRTKKPTGGTSFASLISSLPQDAPSSSGLEEFKRIKNAILTAASSGSSFGAVKEAFRDEDSPQSRALQWVYVDNANAGYSDQQLVQRWVLASFYYASGGDEWVVNEGWVGNDGGGNNDECEWHGVSCLQGVVSKIELEQNRLVGEIVPEIVLLSHLYVLSLGNEYDAPKDERNELVMPLPVFLGDLTYLSLLNLQGVGLTSTIPEKLLNSWTRLESLYLNNNDLTGTLPKNIKKLTSLKVLWLGGNNLGGSIIPEIGQLSKLKDLSLESNFRADEAGERGFIMTLPTEIGQLTNLETLSLADNSLSGQIANSLGDLISLRRLQLSGNYFEGQLPSSLSKLEMLEELDLSFNWLSSTIPVEYAKMTSLTSLKISNNYNDDNGYFTWGLTNTLPTELGKLKNLQHIDLSNNYLTGTLITEFGVLHQLQTLNLQNNFLQGPIPDEYANCVSMREILLQDNNVDGEKFGVPEEICRLPELDLARVDCELEHSCSCCLTTC